MFSQYFGQYLLNKGLLTPEQLYDVLTYERSARAKFGVLAIDAGIMTAAQVEEVHQLQHRMDKKFGEIAITQGYMTLEQLEDLLESQTNRHLSLSQAIIDREYLSLGQLASALEGYKQDNKLTAKQLDAIYNADFDFDNIVRTFLDFSVAGSNREMLYDYVALMMRNFQRFLDEAPVIDMLGDKIKGWLVHQSMLGGTSIFAGLVMGDDVLLALARCYSGEDIAAVDDLAKDSIAEFLNETNGLFTVNMSERGLELDLKPQQILHVETVPVKESYRIPLRISGGQVDLYLAIV